MDFLANHVEALVFCASEPIHLEEIRQTMTEMFEADVPEEAIAAALQLITEKYQSDIYPFEVIISGGGYQFLTKPAYQASIGIWLKQKSKKRLSTAAVETLAIIAYKQPITKSEVEQIRGVNCDYAIQRLLEKELISIKGKAEAVGRPLLYGTSEKFMDYFGINSLKDLPQPKDLAAENSEDMIGEAKD
ncbi:MAG: SMC-Scp complex subunit ScpB [Saprospiraceae bacterium]|nr:SMC-Scp complex subunit ScpB [Saprospiraceae bacterium]